MKIFTAAVVKGGTAKTTTCTALSQIAAAAGQRVLAIDLDPQANFSSYIGADPNKLGSYDLLNGSPAALQLIQQTEQGIYAISASRNLGVIKTTPASAMKLQKALEPLKNNFDVCFIDTPPGILELQNVALHAATGLIIPLEPDSSSLQGLYQIADMANHAKKRNPDLSFTGIVLTKYDNRPAINRYLKDVLIEKGAEMEIPYLMDIRQGIKVREAQAMQQSLFEYAPRSNPAKDYKKLYEMIMEG